jgi:hypothetical protein
LWTVIAVSMLSVAVGVALAVLLGAAVGPSTPAGDLQAQRDAARAELSAAQAELARGEQYFEESASILLAGALEGQTVVTLAVATPDEAAVAGLHERIVQASGAATPSVALGSAWTDPGQVTFRDSLADSLRASVVGVPDEAQTSQVLAHALAQAIFPGVFPEGTDPAEVELAVGLPSDSNAVDRSQVLWQILLDSDLVDGESGIRGTSLVIASGAWSSDEATAADESAELLTLAEILSQYAAGTVVAGVADAPDELASVLADSPIAARVSTVTNAFTKIGSVGVAAALAEHIGGGVGHYGPGGEGRLLPESW